LQRRTSFKKAVALARLLSILHIQVTVKMEGFSGVGVTDTHPRIPTRAAE
jgi:hypothetical protein